MSRSKYTYRLDYGDIVFFMNGLSQEFFKTDKINADNVEFLLDNEEECKDTFISFYQKMRKGLFITSGPEEDAKHLQDKYNIAKQPHLFRLMVLPTYQCNLRCWYCTQEHEDLFISDETVRRLKRLIDNTMKDDNIHDFILSWFGGEPLLCYDTVIELTKYASEQCKSNGKNFGCDITTNGTLLDKSRINELISLGVNSFQITIDGAKSLHDTVKRLPSSSAYEKVMENIEVIAKSNVNSIVRFNYTHKNLQPDEIIRDLKSHLSEDALKNCNFLLYKVWQEDAASVSKELIDKLFNDSRKIGMKTSFSPLDMCYADYHNFCCVFPNGKVAKCDNINPAKITSEVNADGTITWTGQINDVPDITPTSNAICAKCKYYPVCWGPCFRRRTDSQDFTRCVFNEEYIKELLVNYCRSNDNENV